MRECCGNFVGGCPGEKKCALAEAQRRLKLCYEALERIGIHPAESDLDAEAMREIAKEQVIGLRWDMPWLKENPPSTKECRPGAGGEGK